MSRCCCHAIEISSPYSQPLAMVRLISFPLAFRLSFFLMCSVISAPFSLLSFLVSISQQLVAQVRSDEWLGLQPLIRQFGGQCKYLQSQKCYQCPIILISFMADLRDEEALLLLLKAPKKKYIKHLLECSACIDLCHNYPLKQFRTPLLQSFQTDLELTTQQYHRLLLSLSNLVSVAFSIDFDFSNNSPFSSDFDPQLKQILTQSLLSLRPELQESRLNSIRMGNKLLDINWKLDLQIVNQKGKCNIPTVGIQMQSVNNTSAQIDIQKIQMKGEQFLAFFGNLKKIRENLLELVADKGDKAKESNEAKI